MAAQKRTLPPAKPFLKWAGGKTQLLPELERHLPPGIKDGSLTHYAEPFIGGGAFFFDLNRRFSFDTCTISDANDELILTYRVIRRSVQRLIGELEILRSEYRAQDEAGKERFYYRIRDRLNAGAGLQMTWPEQVTRVAWIIFLNRTCYNGLYRVNRSGAFNVPFGRYTRPDILNRENLQAVSLLLRRNRTTIQSGDFSEIRDSVDERTFVYLDPPYRPLDHTSSFTSYSRDGFSASDQIRLATFFRELDERGAAIMLSNSDPKNRDTGDSFFDELYAGYTIERVPARRLINCNGSGRGRIDELIITNYERDTRD